MLHRISGSNRSGDAPSDTTDHCRSSSISKLRGREQWWHSDSTRTRSFSPRRRPCTKDVANASSAQAPKIFSPVENVSRCAVRESVTGYAQITSPLRLRTRKKRFRSRSVRISLIRVRPIPSVCEIAFAGMGRTSRGISLTTKSLTRWCSLDMKANRSVIRSGRLFIARKKSRSGTESISLPRPRRMYPVDCAAFLSSIWMLLPSAFAYRTTSRKSSCRASHSAHVAFSPNL